MFIRKRNDVSLTHPYYICTPTYRRTSAGIRCLHLLCHYLNQAGYEAFVTFFEGGEVPHVNPNLMTPVLTDEVISRHTATRIQPIIVYPEVVPGNPLRGSVIIRYILNYPGLLGGDLRFASSELMYFYSKQFAAAFGVGDQILEIPVLDRTVFHPNPARERRGTCFYAMKYQYDHHKQRVFGLPADAIEITRDRPDSQTPQEIAELFRASEAFYCFENTALGSEAILCHCPTIMMPNPYLRKPEGLSEAEWDGIAWGNADEEVERAKATVVRGAQNYISRIYRFDDQLAYFIKLTQSKAKQTRRRRRISLPDHYRAISQL